ncbi:glycosyltransferase family 4 protein [Aquibacillus sp. 3ASR75-11]|uniref:Glycosyltransferase family 4 protein n=1 Tax=Terrihalobacillus insolitus TaxID=2950438 RepID=A0A9X3WU72_9BACI|nr:glycosyltransferase family 4 protein [Terrihalobacillus insolitus]MDC3423479.1 glycosyltransferase family 4 protein [Terrihalobacillus insolitus]
MKITHICLCGPVTDGWTYQDNLLPKYHKKLGYETSVITSQYIWNQNNSLEINYRTDYYNDYGVKMIRIKNKFSTNINSKFKVYKDLYQTLENENPDILFVHGVQFLDIINIVKYLKKHPNVITYVDNHADFSNSAQNWFSKYFLHGFIWKKCAQMIEPYTQKIYGVLPARVSFLKEVYNLPKHKIELLVMGVDDEKVQAMKNEENKSLIREQYQISNDDFLIITGGKIDNAKKQTLLLMEAVKSIAHPNIKLIVFGSVVEDLKKEVTALSDGEKIKYIGWVPGEESYKYFSSADLVIFPGRHSVFWEQVVGLGIPMFVKYWDGTTHVDLGGNCKFLYEDSVDEIKRNIMDVINNENTYKQMKKVSETEGMKHYSYYEIAKKSIGI